MDSDDGFLLARLRESKVASEQASQQESKKASLGESEWGGVVLVAKGVGQCCFIGHGVSLGVEGTQGQVVVKGMGRHGHGWLLDASKGWHTWWGLEWKVTKTMGVVKAWASTFFSFSPRLSLDPHFSLSRVNPKGIQC